MSISSVKQRNDYIGTGSLSTYAYQFKIFDEDDLLVVERDTGGVETILTKTTDYDVTDAGEAAGGTIVLTVGHGNLATGHALALLRVTELLQLVDFRNQGSFFPETHEDQFDRLVMIDQQQQDELDRSIKGATSVNPTGFDYSLPVLAADQFVRVNSDGDGFVGHGGTPTTGDVTYVGSNAELQAALEGTSSVYIADGTYTIDPGAFTVEDTTQRSIVGASKEKTIIQLSGSTGLDFTSAQENNQRAGVSVRSLTLVNTGTVTDILTGAVGVIGVESQFGTGACFRDCHGMSGCTAINPDNHGFQSCNRIGECITDTDAGNGFYDCKSVSDCRAYSTLASAAGFSNCDQMSECFADGFNYGFSACTEIGESWSTNADLAGYYQCKNVNACKQEGSSGDGFLSCENLALVESQNVDAAGYHFESCTSVLLPVTSGTGAGDQNNCAGYWTADQLSTLNQMVTIDRANYASDALAGTALKAALEDSNIHEINVKYNANPYEITANTTVTDNKLVRAEALTQIKLNGAGITFTTGNYNEFHNLDFNGATTAGGAGGMIIVGDQVGTWFYNCRFYSGSSGSYMVKGNLNVATPVSHYGQVPIGGFIGCTVYVGNLVGKYGFSNVVNLTGCTALLSGGLAVGYYKCGSLENCCATAATIANSDNGYQECLVLTNCSAHATGAAATLNCGFHDCTELTTCSAIADTVVAPAGYTYGFEDCNELTSCRANGMSDDGFDDCIDLSGCRARACTDDGFYGCKQLAGCRSANNGGDGFDTCENISGFRATGNTGWGMNTCSQIAAGDCTGNTAGTYTGSTLQDAGSTK